MTWNLGSWRHRPLHSQPSLPSIPVGRAPQPRLQVYLRPPSRVADQRVGAAGPRRREEFGRLVGRQDRVAPRQMGERSHHPEQDASERRGEREDARLPPPPPPPPPPPNPVTPPPHSPSDGADQLAARRDGWMGGVVYRPHRPLRRRRRDQGVRKVRCVNDRQFL